MRPISRREIRDLASAVAKARRARGDAGGAKIAAQRAKIISGDLRPRHDGKRTKPE